MKFIGFLACLLGLLNSSSWADNAPHVNVVSVQDRPYDITSELGFNAGYYFIDRFYNYAALGLGYTAYLNDYLGWEVLKGDAYFADSTGVNEYVISKGALTLDLDRLQYTAFTSFVYTPIYIKSLGAKNHVSWGDVSFIFGAGLARFEEARNVTALQAGVSFRVKSKQSIDYSLDLRNQFYLKPDLKPNLGINFVINFTLNDLKAKMQAKELGEE